MVLAAAFVVWISLLVRSALLLVAIALSPLALAGATWDATRGWVTKWVTFVVALILSKLVMVVVFLIATAQLSAPIETDLASLAEPLTGIVLLLIGAFAPYLTYKMISFVGFDLYQTMGTETDAKEALNRPVPVLPGGWSRPNPAKVLGSEGAGDGTGSGSPTGGSPGTASTVTASGGTTTGAASAGGGAASGAGAGASSGAGVGAGASAGAGAAAAGVAAPVVAAAALAKGAFDAGPQAGQAVGGHAVQASDGPALTGTAQGHQNQTPASSRATNTPRTDTGPSATPQAQPGILYQDGK